MSCNNYDIARYIVTISGPKDKLKIAIRDIILVSGLGLGDQGTVTLTQQDRVVELPDGIRKLPQLTVTLRFKPFDLESITMKTRLFDWYNKRNTQTYDIDVFVTNRKFCPTHAYRYLGCSIKDLKENDKEMGKVDFSTITATFTPYDIIAFSNNVEALQIWNIDSPSAGYLKIVNPNGSSNSFGNPGMGI